MSIIHSWEKQHTTGTPPHGVWGYGSCSSGTDIYYFGGHCGHTSCYHNSLFRLRTATLVWDELVPITDHIRPMKKYYCALLAFGDQLLAFGGKSETGPSHPSLLAKYERHGLSVYTNEHHLFDRKRGEGHILNTVALHMLITTCFKFYLSLIMATLLMADVPVKFH